MNLAIFIHGKASAGKDTCVKAIKYFRGFTEVPLKEQSKELQKLLDNKPSLYDTPEIITMPFADEVRKELCRIDPTVDFDRLCHDYEYKTQYRKQLIDIGDGYRKIDPAIWVDKHYLAIRAWHESNNGKIVCIPDMRYSTGNNGDEFEYAKELNDVPGLISITVKVKASLVTRLLRMSPQAIKKYACCGITNPSENLMDHISDREFDYVCDNEKNNPNYFNTDLINLAVDIDKLFQKIKEI